MEYMKLNATSLRDRVLNKVLGAIVEKYTPSTDKNVATGFLNTTGLTFESVKAQLNSSKETPKRQALLAVLDTVETGVLSYMMKNVNGYRTTEELIKNGYAQEAVTSEVYEEEVSGTSMAGIVAELLEEMADAPPEEIKSLAKEILKMEKDTQDSNKEQDEADQNDFVEEGDASGDKGEDSENPFGDGSEDDKNSDNSGSDSGDGSNPFGDDVASGDSGDDNVFAKDDSENSSDNPFNSEDQGSNSGEGGQSEGQTNSNPFANDSSQASDNSNGGNGNNPFESYSGNNSYSAIARDVYTAAGIESGDILKFVTKYVSNFQGSKMEETFKEYGAESLEFKAEQDRYVRYTQVGVESIANTLSVCKYLGISLDMYKYKYMD